MQFEELMKVHAGQFWRANYPDSLTEEEKLHIENLLGEVFKQGSGSCMAALLDYLKAIRLVRAYPLTGRCQPQNVDCLARLQDA